MAADIDHVVVLMLENRSFDHMLGFLNHPAGLPDISGQTNPDQNGNEHGPSPSATATLLVSPGHEHTDVMQQIAPDGTINNQGFVMQFEQIAKAQGQPGLGPAIMRCQHESNIPVLATLAREFAVCTNWHCSVPGMTWPNRNFAHAGTSDGEVDIVKRLYFNPTIFEQLSDHGKDWRIYSDNDAVAQAQVFRNLWWHGWRNRFQGLDTFIERAERGALPHYSFIEPDHFLGYSSSQHPMNNTDSTDDFRAGEELIRRIYEALRSNDDVWHRSLFVITYDEHGGFFDHKPPPQSPGFEVAETHPSFRFDVLGPRVPSVIVSPYIEPGTVVDRLLDHTSIIKTVREIHIPQSPPLSRRETAVNSFTDVPGRTTPRPAHQLPVLQPAALNRDSGLAFYVAKKTDPQIDEFQESLLWLREEITRDLPADDKAIGMMASESDSTLYRLNAAREDSRDRFRSASERLVVLHTPDGTCIEQPSALDIEQLDLTGDDSRAWIEDVNAGLLIRKPDQTLLYSDATSARTVIADSATARQAFEMLRTGQVSELQQLFEQSSDM